MAIYTVTTTEDSGAGSLRQAIIDANANAGDDQINLKLTGGTNPYTIYLNSALPDIINASTTLPGGGIAGNITISGPGASSLIINGNNGDPNRNFGIFSVAVGGNLTISGVTLTGARKFNQAGGAIDNAGTLTVSDSTLSGNYAAIGGGIRNIGNAILTVHKSTISGNTAWSGPGGGIWNEGTLTVSNSTIYGNSASSSDSGQGGGIFNGNTGTITNSTISGNSANKTGGGGGIYNGAISGNPILNIANTIIANSTSGGDYAGSGTVNPISPSTAANNLVSQGAYSWATTNTSLQINLGPLANNGGKTQTLALLTGSVAIGAADANISNASPISGFDQRGYTRSATAPSIGAYEVPTVTLNTSNLANNATTLTITGTGFDSTAANNTVTFNNGAVGTVTSATATQLTVNFTAGTITAGSLTAIVTTNGISSASAVQVASVLPTVTQNLSNLANNATTLTITGTGFDPIAANNIVTFYLEDGDTADNSATGTVTSATATQLIVTFNTAPGNGTKHVRVTTNAISSGNQVRVANIVQAPVITSISPAAGPRVGGSTITINGLSFINQDEEGNVTGVSAVTIGGIAATNFTVVNGQKITATIPPGIFGPADVLVTTVNGTNSTTANTKFNYTAGAFDAPAEPFAPAFPHAISINAPGSTVGTSASFTVTFNQPVTGVDASDFTLIRSGTVAGGNIQVTGSGATRTVTVTDITGAGTLGLNLVNLPTITALPSFAAQPTIVATGSKPASVILGDVNGDGELDIITANFGSANVSVLLGKGNGTFEGQQTFATGTKPFAVKLGDINGDGSVDIITANQDSDTASVLIGNGNGTFQTQSTFSTWDSPRSVALGDLNGDGTLDIIAANQGSNNVSVLLGTGNGTFAGQATFATASLPYSVALGDVNGDGKLDIVAANRSGSFGSLLLGNGDGTFKASEAFNAGGSQVYVALGDLNGDGKLDIVTPKPGNDVVVLIGNGNGTFNNPLIFSPGTNPRSVTLSDVNGDGRLDIITANFGSTDTSVLLGNGNGTFQGATKFATGTNSRSATLGDVNGDGRLDIIAANYNSDNASVILGTGGSALFATFSPQQTFAAGNGAQSQALGDLNGDGKLDMVTANGGNSTASVLLGNGNGTFQTQTTFATGTSPRAVTLGDVNDDGKLDIITANRHSNTASVLLGNGNGTFQTQTTFATGNRPYSVALGDVNGDGRLDIITANDNDNNASVLLGNGNGTFQTQATFATGSSPRAVAMGDVDGDGKLDIITANHGDASASMLLGNGNGTFKPKADFATGSNPRALTLGDVNGDGNLDIITANFANSVSVLLGNGNGTFKPKADFATEGSPRSVALGDINGDGRLDIITASYSSDTASVLLGNGNGTFAAEVAFAAGDGPLSVALGDLNGDGRLDITTANFNSGDASVLLNSLAFTGQTATVDAIAPTAPTITSITDDAAPIIGTIAPGGITNDTSLLLAGSAEAASTVSIYNGSDLLGTTPADNTGAWSYTANLSNGTTTYAFKATATDAPGNVSPASSPNYSVTVDTTAPAAPTITSITDDAEPITGTIAHGGFTNDTSLLLTGTAEAASTVSIYNGSTLLGTTTADTTTGAWSFSAIGLANGSTYAFNATATDAAGNVSNASSPQQTFTTETGPFSVALGDVNGDGRLDIITANSASNNASVLLGNGNGTLQGQQIFATGQNPNSVALGDVNNDGKLDLITANRDSNTASVLLGNGNGTFQTQTTFFAGPGAMPRSVNLGDVNGDGTLDIITANAYSANVSVLLGNGNGTFQIQATFATGSGPNSEALGDVNGDGTLDIITANLGSTTVSVLLGNGNGTFQGQQTFATGANPFSVSMGDVNGDGRLDIITANLGSANVSVLLGNGNGTFGPKTDISTGTGSNPASVTLGDVNGDGRLDIITANAYSANVSVLLGNGNGSFQEKQTLTTDAGPVSVALGDINADGRLDIITANLFSANVSVHLESLAFTGQKVTVDTTAPAAPSITSITDNVTPVTGTIAPGGVTNDTSLVLTGTAEAACSVSIYNGSTLLGTTTADNTTGAWSYSANGLSGGTTYVFKATATDAAGNVSAASSPNYSVTVDTAAPSAPTITSITDDVSPITGTIAPGGFTNDTSLDLTGTAEAASSVSIYNGSTLLGTTTADTTTGAWSYSANGLSGGTTYVFKATSTDAAGNVSAASSPNYSVTVDTTAPAAPTINSITDDAAPITGTIAPGGFTNDTSLDLTGTAEAASSVSIYNGSTLLGTTTADNTTGVWSYSATGLSGGSTYAFNATATDAAGNISPTSTNYSVTVDTAAPAAPSITSITDNVTPITGTIAPGGFTNDTSLDLTGTAEAASTVSIYNGSELLGTTTANNTTGAWSYSATGLSGGSTYSFKATATDAAGNVSAASSYSVTVDTTAPAAPTITSITDDAAPITGTIAPGGFTNDTSLLLTGTAEAASTVSIYNGSTLLATTTADTTTGAWSYSATGLSGGTTYAFKATATDAAGNVSAASSPNYSVTVDTAAPAAPSITSITDNVTPITGTVAPGGFTNDTSLDLTGTAEAASTVSIYNGSSLLGTTTADNTTGAWSYSATGLANGATYAFKATATDAAGNVSAASSPNYSVTVDTTSPSPNPSGITSANSNGRYGFGSTITLQVAFTETVYVTGSPTLLLETGSTDRAALYKGGSGTNTLSFDYTVQLGDRSADLDISSSAALTLQGGSIQDAAGNGASLTQPAAGAPGSLGANAELVIDDSAPSAGTSFTTTQGASGLINKPVVINQKTDPLTGGSVVANTLLVFNNATPDSSAASGLQLRVNGNGSNPAATVTSASDLISFRVSPSVSTSGNVSNLDVNGITTSAVAAFQATIQEVDLYFPEAPGSGWNALYKKNKNGVYFLFNYDPLTGLGGVLLDRDGINGIDGARLYLKDGALGDFDETVNGRIDDPIGFTTLSTAPTLQLSGDGKGLTVDGVDGTGLWISLAVSSFSSAAQSNLEMYNNDQPLGAIGATLGSGPTGSQAIYLAAGSTLSFRSSDGVGNSSNNPALRLSSTPTGYSLGLDADRNGSYTDLMLDISSSIAASSPASLAIARKQLSSSDAILDLTSIAASGITLTLDISTDCGLRNRFGFVKLDPLTGSTYQVAGVSQNDGAAFRSAVLSQFIDPYLGTTTSHRHGQSRQSISWNLNSSAAGYYAPVMVTQGGEVLTFGASTASDGRQHVKLLGTNTFGFEDLLASQGSDWDFNDTKIRVSVV